MQARALAPAFDTSSHTENIPRPPAPMVLIRRLFMSATYKVSCWSMAIELGAENCALVPIPSAHAAVVVPAAAAVISPAKVVTTAE